MCRPFCASKVVSNLTARARWSSSRALVLCDISRPTCTHVIARRCSSADLCHKVVSNLTARARWSSSRALVLCDVSRPTCTHVIARRCSSADLCHKVVSNPTMRARWSSSRALVLCDISRPVDYTQIITGLRYSPKPIYGGIDSCPK